MIDFKSITEAADMARVAASFGITTDSHHKAICPFHDDRRPSMQIYAHDYHCFVCGAHGDAIGFVARLKGCTMHEAAQIVVDICGGSITEMTSESHKRQTERRRREEEYDRNLDRMMDIEKGIAECREMVYNVSPYSDTWCYYQRKLDNLLMEREVVDGKLMQERFRRYGDKRKNR